MTSEALTSEALYRLMTWLSPGFPVGAFSYSHGLEAAVEERLVHDEWSLGDWIEAGIIHGFGRIDGAIFSATHKATVTRDSVTLSEVHFLGAAMVPTREFELETIAQGRAFWLTLNDVWRDDPTIAWAAAQITETEMPYSVAVGIAAAAAGVPLRTALAAYLHAVASNLVSAGVRLIPLGQTSGQRCLARLQETVMSAAEAAMTRPLSNIGSAAPMFEWASMRHEIQYTRLFRS